MTPITLAGKDVTEYFHVCAFFDSRQQEYEVLAPFSKEGLEHGEKAVHIVGPDMLGEHVERLDAHGVGCASCAAAGQLDVLPWDQVYVPDGRFNQDRMMATIESVLAAGREAGFPKTRLWANMGWTLEGYPSTLEVLEFESRVNDVLARTKQLAVCVYDTSKISGAMMTDILRSHPLTLIGNVIHENPFYTPPEQLVEELRARRHRGMVTPAGVSAA